MNYLKGLFVCIIAINCSFAAIYAQDPDILINHEVYHFIDRIDIRGVLETPLYTDMKPYGRDQISQILRFSHYKLDDRLPATWNTRMREICDDGFADSTGSRPVLRHFFKNGRDLFHKRIDDFEIYLNPILYLTGGLDRNNYGDSVTFDRNLLYRNTRGIQVRGSIFRKVGFFSEVTENQWKTPAFVGSRYDERKSLWGEGFVKTFDETTNRGFDYFNGRGYLTYSPFRQMRIKFGKDRYFAGNGIQSMFLSDHAADHLFLHLDTRIWKIQYINHFGQMIDFLPSKADDMGAHPKKWFVFHQLNVTPTYWLSIGLFESIVYSPVMPGGIRGFELEYLNPIIFYRSTEQFLGSPDNAFLGLTWKANLLKRFQLYGQINLDDYNIRRRSEGSGFHGNRHAIQAGAKYIDAFSLTGLDLQLEYNQVRPFTYSHFNPTSNYTHYGQFLAHASGANLRDLTAVGRYQATSRLYFTVSYTTLWKGLDSAGVNMGGGVFRPPLILPREFGNVIGQGMQLYVKTLYGKVAYQLWKLNLFFEAEARIRIENELSSYSATAGFRWNIAPKPVKF